MENFLAETSLPQGTCVDTEVCGTEDVTKIPLFPKLKEHIENSWYDEHHVNIMNNLITIAKLDVDQMILQTIAIRMPQYPMLHNNDVTIVQNGSLYGV